MNTVIDPVRNFHANHENHGPLFAGAAITCARCGGPVGFGMALCFGCTLEALRKRPAKARPQ